MAEQKFETEEIEGGEELDLRAAARAARKWSAHAGSWSCTSNYFAQDGYG
jgi:hypothetical protein